MKNGTWRCGTASFTARWGRSGGVVAVHGEIDAANSDQFINDLQHLAAYCEWLVVDLGALEFIGTTGFAALRTIDAWFTEAEINWVLVAGAAVSRLFKVCEPRSTLPAAESVADALTTLQKPERLLRTV